jgi:hypothetical protein
MIALDKFRFRCSAILALSFSVLSLTANVWAGTIQSGQLPTMSVTIEGSPNSTWPYKTAPSSFNAVPDSGGAYDYTDTVDQNILQDRAHIKILDLDFNPDPFVLNNFLITNNTTTMQVFSVFVGLPTSLAGPSLISGNVRTDVIDGGLDGATIATVALQSIYQAQIDFVTVATLQNDPFSVVAPAGSSNSNAVAFGPVVNAIPITSNMGIQLRFTLTPGDTASILSRFDAIPVPEPSNPVLIGMVAALVFGVRGRPAKS